MATTWCLWSVTPALRHSRSWNCLSRNTRQSRRPRKSWKPWSSAPAAPAAKSSRCSRPVPPSTPRLLRPSPWPNRSSRTRSASCRPAASCRASSASRATMSAFRGYWGKGVEKIIEFKLDAEEQAMMDKSVAAVKELVDTFQVDGPTHPPPRAGLDGVSPPGRRRFRPTRRPFESHGCRNQVIDTHRGGKSINEVA